MVMIKKKKKKREWNISYRDSAILEENIIFVEILQRVCREKSKQYNL